MTATLHRGGSTLLVLRTALVLLLLTGFVATARSGQEEQAAYVPGEERKSAKCGGGDPCVFVNRDAQWVEYIPTNDPRNSHKPKPVPPQPGSFEGEDVPILISISSFRDKLCPVTLFNIFSKAQHRDRIAVQVVQQNDNALDKDCFDEYCKLMQAKYGYGSSGDTSAYICPYADNIHVLRISAAEAKGPQWARGIGSEMLQQSFAAAAEYQDSTVASESFCMQTDSHMDFVADFDRLVISMWAEAKNEMGVLSTYVASLTELGVSGEHDRGLNNLHEVPHLCMLTLHGGNDLPRNWGTKCARMLPEPKLTNAMWGAGLSFSRCHAELKVPYDPHLPHIFDGEEFTRGLRFFTHGYDVYTPHRVYVLHNYKDSQSDPVHSQWGSQHRRVAGSVERIKQLLQMSDRKDKTIEAAHKVQYSKYGLGDRRSLDQGIAFTGINLKKREITANRCGNIDWVPYTAHPNGPAYVQRYDSETEVFIDTRDRGSIFYDPSAAPPPPVIATTQKQKHLANIALVQGEDLSLVQLPSASLEKNGKLTPPLLSLRGLEGVVDLFIGTASGSGSSRGSGSDITATTAWLQATLRADQFDTSDLRTIQREIDVILFCLLCVLVGVIWAVGNRRFGHLLWAQTGKEFGSVQTARMGGERDIAKTA
eukprot:GSChrysophyteH2.ASY1.ANO1.778.1 assembled CDS